MLSPWGERGGKIYLIDPKACVFDAPNFFVGLRRRSLGGGSGRKPHLGQILKRERENEACGPELACLTRE